jgi:hypothetical protein
MATVSKSDLIIKREIYDRFPEPKARRFITDIERGPLSVIGLSVRAPYLLFSEIERGIR